jgi:GTP diphosphokinase / guanosine-3',5'-bis(diphosphate) 3'-diphosphatase
MLPRIDHVIEKAKAYNPGSDARLLQKAYLFSAMAHEGQVRLSGEPYLIHPIAVTDILADIKADDIALVAGLLHDVVEDSHQVSLADIEKRFGSEVAHIVDGVTKIEEKVPLHDRQEGEWATLRKVVLAMADDIRVILVKLADRLHNLRTMQAMPEHRRPAKALETLEIYAPIAYRLGMGKMKIELEELGFRYAWPEEYERLQGALQEKRAYSLNFIEETTAELRKMLKHTQITGDISGRTKHLYSIWLKLNRQGIGVEQVYDYMAFRILVESVQDCYGVLGGIHSLWKPIPGRFKDFIALPKENHYRSLHTSVVGINGQPFEIQIRTHQMHQEAENGIAAHWHYKEGRLSKEDETATTQWLRQLAEWKQEGATAGEFIQNLRVDLYPKDVYVFTPKGKVMPFPRGATPIDFAYSVHTDVGHHCVGAKVNGKLVPLKTPLKSGDRVEIVTSPSGKPSRDWLKAAVTGRALSKIKAWLNVQEKRRAVELGKASLDREMKRIKVNLKEAEESGLLAKAIKTVSLPDLESLLAEIGYGKLSARIFARKLAPPREEPAMPTLAKGGGPSPPKEHALEVRGASDLLTTLAKCCKPIRGDEIIGFISRGRGLMVHRADCPNIGRLGYNPDRIMQVSWGSGAAASATHDVSLDIRVEDKPGIVAAITQAVADAKAPLRAIEGNVDGAGAGSVKITLVIRDRTHLNHIVAQIAKLNGILEIHRRYR